MKRAERIRKAHLADLAERLRAVRQPKKPSLNRHGLHLGFAADGTPLHIDLGKHILGIGQTGSGKTQFIKYCLRHLLTSEPSASGILVDCNGTHTNSLFHSILAFNERVTQRPVVLFDPSVASHVTTCNVLACAPHEDPSVVAGAVLSSMASRAGEANFDQSPLLRTALKALLITAAELGLTLPDVMPLLDVEDRASLRRRALQLIQDPFARDFLQQLETASLQSNKADFNARIMGPYNRLAETQSSRIVRGAQSGSVDPVDFPAHFERRGIVLINGSGSAHASDIDARSYASLILSTIVRQLFRRERLTPVAIFIDEAQYVAGASDLDVLLREGRKYGVSVAVFTQTFETFKKTGLLPTLLGNCEVVVVGRLKDMNDAEEVTRQCFEVDLEAPLVASIRPTVVGQERITLCGESDGEAESDGTSRAIGRSQSAMRSEGFATSESVSEGESQFSGWSEGEAYGASSGDTTSISDSTSWGHSATDSVGVSQNFGLSAGVPVERDVWGNPQPKTDFIEGYTLSTNDGVSAGSATGSSIGGMQGRGQSHAQSQSAQLSRGVSEGGGTNRSASRGQSSSTSYGTAEGHSVSEGRSASRSKSRTRSRQESLGSVFANLPNSFHSLPNQQHRIAHVLRRMRPGQMLVAYNNHVVMAHIPLVKSRSYSRAELNDLKLRTLLRSPYTMRTEDALEAARKRLADFVAREPRDASFEPVPMPILDDVAGFAQDYTTRAKAKRRKPKRDLRVIDGGKDEET